MKDFKCQIILQDGSCCGKVLSSRQALLTHQRKRNIFGHKTVYVASALVLNNMCPVCLTVFRSKLVAQNHLRKSSLKNYCDRECVVHKYEIQKLDEYSCQLCDFVDSSMFRYCLHARTHLPLLQVRTSALGSRPKLVAVNPARSSSPPALRRRRRPPPVRGDGTYRRSASARLRQGNEAKISLHNDGSGEIEGGWRTE